MKTLLATTALFLAALCGTSIGAPIKATGNDTQCYSKHILPHHSGIVEYKLLSGVKFLTRNSLKSLYTATLELQQSINFLQVEMGCRAGEQVPPPHHHCFLQERDEQTFLYNATDRDLTMDANRLAADLCSLVNFTTALHHVVCYEQYNHSGEFNADMTDVHTRFVSILKALSNITGVPLPSDMPLPTTAPEADEEDVSSQGDESASPSVTRTNRHTRHTGERESPAPPPAASTYPPLDQSDEDLLNQGSSRSRRQAVEPQNQDRCSFPQTDADQFLYIYEFYQAVWYLISDLKAMTQ